MITIDYDDGIWGRVMKIKIPWPLKEMSEAERSDLSSDQIILLKSGLEKGYLTSSQTKILQESLVQILGEYGIAVIDVEEDAVEVSKYCPGCNNTKPLEHFNRRTHILSEVHANCCDSCFVKARKNRYNLKRNYEISYWDFLRMLIKQEGKCAICGTQPEKGLHLDHCHDTKNNRDLLCMNCNVGIGHLKYNPKSLQAAIDYLERHRLIPSE